ncbi:hypothetical protein DAI22_08g250050 [Oryza sativa Japonica Group]|jgi:hypothetical protein|nr:hypothetical protein DAI22_08g250050 [Oryza sativa Japonica Group]
MLEGGLKESSVHSRSILTVSPGVPSLTTNPSRASNTIIFELFLPPFKCDTIARLGFGVVNKLFVEVEPVAPFESEDGATTVACRWLRRHQTFPSCSWHSRGRCWISIT